MKLSATEQKIITDVEQHGFHIERMAAQNGQPGWAYSIGIHKTVQQPEIIIFGLRPDTMQMLINNTAERMNDGVAYADGTEDEELLQGYTCMFKSVREIWYDVAVSRASWFYGGSNFPLLQLYWPDRNGKYPWDPKCQPEVRALQPRLHLAEVDASGAGWLLP